HVDNAIRHIPGTPHRIRTDLSATLFFSEPEEYDGGELIIEDSFGSHLVKLPAGEMVLILVCFVTAKNLAPKLIQPIHPEITLVISSGFNSGLRNFERSIFQGLKRRCYVAHKVGSNRRSNTKSAIQYKGLSHMHESNGG